jgi:hypothetical protein
MPCTHPDLEGELEAVDWLAADWLHDLGLWAELNLAADLVLQTLHNCITVLRGRVRGGGRNRREAGEQKLRSEGRCMSSADMTYVD